MVQLVEINNKKCVVVITRFGMSGSDAGNRMRSTVDGYICKNLGEITIDEGIKELIKVFSNSNDKIINNY